MQLVSNRLFSHSFKTLILEPEINAVILPSLKCHNPCYIIMFLGDYSIRLVNGNSDCSGRVEILYNGQWGTVCDDSWDMNHTAVVCRQLGCGTAVSAKTSAHFGAGSGQIWLDDVKCSGHESSLTQCSHPSFGTHNCGHSEDAGVICSQGISVFFLFF